MATNQPEEKLKYDDFLHLTVSSLKDFLALRGLKQTGTKAELIAQAFGAYELNAPKKFSQEQIYEKIREEYAKRLKSIYWKYWTILESIKIKRHIHIG